MTIDLPPKVVAAIDECSKHWGSPTVARRHLSEIARLAIEEALQPEGMESMVEVPRALLHRIQVLCGDLGVQTALHNILAVGADDAPTPK